MLNKSANNKKDISAGTESVNSVRFFSHSTRLFKHHVPTEFVLLGFIEFFALLAAYYVGIDLRFSDDILIQRFADYLPQALVFVVIMQMSLIAFSAYQRQPAHSTTMLAARIGASMMLGMVVLSLTFYIAPVFFLGRGAFALAVFVSFVVIMMIRLIFMRISSVYDLRLRILILGAGRSASLVRNAEAQGELKGVNLVCFMPMPGDQDTESGISLVKTPGALVKYIAENQIDTIVLAMDERREGLPVHELLDCKMGGVEVLDLLTFFERHTSKIRLDIMQPSWLFLSEGFEVNNFRRMWKRVFDVICVLLLLPVVLPVAAISVLAILIEGRWREGVIYSQTRVSENGRLFQIYKFRSMVVEAERDGIARWAAKNDVRITRVGAVLRKFRLDELPQLFNVLKGDMSFVGPRPERPEFVEKLSEKIPYYNERHRVKPGLSGWAQIRYSYGASEEDGFEKLQYDLYYVKNCSILLDILVLLQTAEVVLLGKGAQ
ncbi:MAG: TIGR03013 family XrtA/PEP-CTERM system glycosyltransferase [Gammaproteobacteria bacterium]